MSDLFDRVARSFPSTQGDLRPEPDDPNLFMASMRMGNPVVAVTDRAASIPESLLRDDSSYNPLDPEQEDLDGYPIEAFVSSNSPLETMLIKKHIDNQRADLQRISDAGLLGFGTLIGAAVVDPINLIPVVGPLGKIFHTAKIFRSTSRAARIGRAGIEAFGQSAISEAILQSQLDVRQTQETIANVLGSAVFASVIRGGIDVALLPGKGVAQTEKAVMAEVQASIAPDGSVGAQKAVPFSRASDFDVDKKLFEGARDAAPEGAQTAFGNSWALAPLRALSRISPRVRLGYDRISRAARDWASTRSDIAWLQKDGPVAPSIESRIVARHGLTRADLQNLTSNSYVAYKQEGGQEFLGKQGARLYREAVGRALGRGDQIPDSLVPEKAARDHINKVAGEIRSRLSDLEDELIEAGALQEKFSSTTAQSYFTRVYNKLAVQEDIVTDPFTGQEVRFLGTAEDPGVVRKWLMEEHGITDEEILQSAGRTIRDHITGLDAGYDGLGGRGVVISQLQNRKITLPDEVLEPFLIRDVDTVLDSLYASLGPKIEMARSPVSHGRHFGELRGRVKSAEEALEAGDLHKSAALAQDIDDIRVSRLFHLIDDAKKGRQVDDLIESRANSRTRFISARKKVDANKAIIEAFEEAEGFAKTDLAAELPRVREELAKASEQAKKAKVEMQTADATLQVFRSQALALDVFGGLRKGVAKDVQPFVYRTSNVEAGKALAEARGKAFDAREEAFRDGYNQVAWLHRVNSDYEKAIQKLPPGAEQQRLQKERARALGDMQLMRDKLLQRSVADVSQLTKELLKFNAYTKLGNVALSSIVDIPRAIAINGFEPWAKSFITAMREPMELFGRASKDEALELSTVLDTMRTMSRFEANMDIHMSKSGAGFVAGTDALTDNFMKFTGIRWLDSRMRRMSQLTSMNRIIRDSLTISKGGVLKGAARKRLRLSGISDELAEAIAQQYNRHGQKVGMQYLANTQDWGKGLQGEELARAIEARDLFRAALIQDANSAVPRVGSGDLPKFHNKTLGKLMLNFRTFMIASMNRVMTRQIALHDASVAASMLMQVGLGMMAWYLREKIVLGKDVSDDPRDWVFNGIDRSDILGPFMEINNIVEKTGMPGISSALGSNEGSARYRNLDLMAVAAGPTAGTLRDVSKFLTTAADGKVSAAEIEALRRITPYMSLPPFRRAIEEVKKEFE